MTSLLTRLKALTPESPTSLLREIDGEIALANGWTKNRGIGTAATDSRPHYWRSPWGQICPNVPRYTEIDNDARTLIPDGLWWFVCSGRSEPEEPFYGAHLCRPGDPDGIVAAGESDATPAIALLIAIMQAKEEAKQEMEGKSDGL